MSDANENFLCPITGEVMKDPVSDREGNTYERAAIEDWLRRNPTSPITRTPLDASSLAPNRALKNMIEEFLRTGGTISSGRPRVIQGTPVIVPSNLPPAPSEISVSITESKITDDLTSGEKNMLVSLIPPNGNRRIPLDLVLVIGNLHLENSSLLSSRVTFICDFHYFVANYFR